LLKKSKILNLLTLDKKVEKGEKVEKVKKTKKIDFHVHVTPPEISGNPDKYTQSEPYFAMLSSNPKNKFATAEEVVKELDRTGFDQAVIFGFGFRDMGLCRLANDYVIAKVREHPDRLIGYMTVAPKHPELEKEIDRCQSAGLRGIGELFPAGQDFRIEEADDTRLFAGLCRERALPVIVHTNEPIGHYYLGKTNTTLRQLEQFVENSPGTTIIFAHWGGGFFFYEMMPELKKKCKDLYYDNAATVFLYNEDIYKVICTLGLEKKMLFGSDFPLLPLTRYSAGIEKSKIPEETKALLLGGNAEALLRRTGAIQ
jgi:predicted TIM-barrel fold metal-dependent hydrolase